MTDTGRATGLRPATPADIPALAAVLALAFADDPYLAGVVAVRDERLDERLRSMWTGVLRFVSNHLSDTLTTTDLAGVAAWLPPGRTSPRGLDGLQVVPYLAGASGWRRVAGTLASLAELSRRHERHVREPHWYLVVLGVAPERQGQGIGSSLIRPTLERCDHEGRPAYLETTLERNVPFYERHGFRVVEALDMPATSVPGWLMRREPQPNRNQSRLDR